MFHPTWTSKWKIQLAVESSDDESESSEDEGIDGLSTKDWKGQEQERYLKHAAKTAPPRMTMRTSTGGFNVHKRAVPLVYFCQMAFDKFAKGGLKKSCFKIDWDRLAERGAKENDWEMQDEYKIVNKEEQELESKSQHKDRGKTEKRQARSTRRTDEPQGSGSADDAPSDGDSDHSLHRQGDVPSSEEVSGSDASDDEDITTQGKRKRSRQTKSVSTPRKKRNAPATPSKRSRSVAKRTTTPKKRRLKVAETYGAITTELDPLLLPEDPFERALYLLHVGATPDTLPCRESEFVDVLMRVEEGVESGGGGCLCECCPSFKQARSNRVIQRYRRSARDRENGHCPCSNQTTQSESRGGG